MENKSEVSLEVLHSELLNMMKSLHSFLVEHNIKYTLIAGSLLGAVRHQGFIPWDDDLDIAMLRSEYNKLMAVAHKLPVPLRLHYRDNANDNDNYPYTFAKIENARTLLIENAIEHLGVKSGLYIDIFIYDKVPHFFLTRVIHYIKISYLRTIRRFLVVNPSKNRSVFKQIIVTFVRKHYNLMTVIDSIISESSKYESSSSKVVQNLTGDSERFGPVFQEPYFQNIKEVKYADAMFYSIENPEKYLKETYGNYMQLPPEDMRIPCHNFYLEFLKNDE